MEIECTVFFEGPFWVAVFEKQDENGFSAARVVFGPEPSDPQLLDFALRSYTKLSFSRPVQTPPERGVWEAGFKRRQREIHRRMETDRPGSTRAQLALKKELEDRLAQRKIDRQAEQESEAVERFRLHQEKKKAKRRGH